MTNLARYLSAYLREYLPCERRASTHTCETYAYSFQLLVIFVARKQKTTPSKLSIEQLDVTVIVEFLNYLESDRGNSPRTRNARSAAIKAFFRFLEYRCVSCLDQSRRIQAIPTKKIDEKIVAHLTRLETEALLAAPDPRTAAGVRDRAMLMLCVSTGLRVSELVGLSVEQVELGSQSTIHVIGKGRKERILPLWKETANAIKAWLVIRTSTPTVHELFLNAQGHAMTRSGFEYILTKHAKTAAQHQPALGKKKISPHALRHTCAMNTLQATHDIRKVSLWLGHADLKSTEIYLRAEPAEKLETLMATVPPALRGGKFRAPDKLLAMLRSKQ